MVAKGERRVDGKRGEGGGRQKGRRRWLAKGERGLGGNRLTCRPPPAIVMKTK